jgi:hypothetical protein
MHEEKRQEADFDSSNHALPKPTAAGFNQELTLLVHGLSPHLLVFIQLIEEAQRPVLPSTLCH